MRTSFLFKSCLLSALLLGIAVQPSTAETKSERAQNQLFAQRVLADKDLDDLTQRARALLKTGLNAGSTYPEIWIRDFATFMEISCEVNDRESIRKSLLLLLRFQRADGNIPDGLSQREVKTDVPPPYLPPEVKASLKTTILTWREVIENPRVPDYQAFKNSVETDQETSLVQAVHTYIKKTGDKAILNEVVDGRTMLEHLDDALDFLMEQRFSPKYGLVFGATTIDWGDIAPEDNPGAVFNDKTHRAIDIYDNAMFLLAIDDMVAMAGPKSDLAKKWKKVGRGIRTNARKHLWDTKSQKFIPHIYLGESPFPKDFDENAVWYHGGTAVAIQAGLLNKDEIAASLQAMRLNIKQVGGLTVGITNIPVYPKGLFVNGNVDPWVYQNGGDWDWFGGRMVQALVQQGFGPDAYLELLPMVQRVKRHNGFYEWFDLQDKPRGSGTFRGSAGVLGKATEMLQSWARTQLASPTK
jgi:glycogen debranching enzyme